MKIIRVFVFATVLRFINPLPSVTYLNAVALCFMLCFVLGWSMTVISMYTYHAKSSSLFLLAS